MIEITLPKVNYNFHINVMIRITHNSNSNHTSIIDFYFKKSEVFMIELRIILIGIMHS